MEAASWSIQKDNLIGYNLDQVELVFGKIEIRKFDKFHIFW